MNRNTKLPDLILQNHEDFLVVRGDLLPGGIKAKCIAEVFSEIKKGEVVYAAHAYGHSGYALGLAGLYHNKKVTLFFSGPEVDTCIYTKTKSLNNVTCNIIDEVSHQKDLVTIAREYAKKNGAYFIPIGFDYPSFTRHLIALAKSLPISPKEVWVAGGSGTTSRCLTKAWPNAKINTVNLGMMPDAKMAGTIYKVPEKPFNRAELPPPYPSSPWYDSKIWRFVKEHATPGALIWNIA
ncbi:MAG: hypothetical protein EXS51_00180 [Candidatus Taylorbacteria bacterium]|nr:hypothetical protein [Candidatus Taylorbacteria bacterium]